MARQEWDQLPDEPDLWFARFEIYRQLGPARSFNKAFRVAKEEDGDAAGEGLTGERPGSNWAEKAKRFRWVERARAYDAWEREQFREKELEIALDRRLSRLQKIKELEERSFTALLNAKIDEMDVVTARAYLPQLRMLFVALLGSERAEFGAPADEDGQQSSALQDDILQHLEKTFGKKVAVGDSPDKQ